jgi:undecaprenyl-diphosphatase
VPHRASGLLLVAGCCGVAFVVLAALVWAGTDWLVAADAEWSARAYAFMLTHPWCEALARAATWMGGGAVITTVTAVAVLTCALLRRRVLAWWLAVTVAGAAAANTVLKTTLEQTRPPTAGVQTSAHGFAFPSGHTQAATVTYVALVLVVAWQIWAPSSWARWVSAAAVVTLVVGVGLSRLFLGAHWPSDVLGGWLFGATWVAAATAVLLLRQGGPGQRPVGR